MNRIFGSTSKTPKPNLNDSISSNDTRIDAIEVKLRKLDAELTKYRDQLKRLRDGAGKTAVQKRAMAVLKQKKLYEKQKEDLQAQNYNIESVQMTTDNLRNTMATVDAMQSANKEMKKQYGKLDINKIESIHYDMEDLMEQANEVQESMSRTYGVPEEVDEADLEAELEALGDDLGMEADEMPSYLQESAGGSQLPDFVDEAPVESDPQKAGPVKAV